MNSPDDAELLDPRQVLRLKLHAQRELIARQLGPDPAALSGDYPRSMTMRFLRRRPGLAGKVLTAAATLLVRTSGRTSLGAGLTLAGIVKAALVHRRDAAAAAARSEGSY